MQRSIIRLTLILLFPTSLALSACGGDSASPDGGAADAAQADAGADAAVDDSELLFDPTRVIEISVDMDADDWRALRNQGQDMSVLAEGCKDGPPGNPYSVFPGEVTVDGVTLPQVGVRKKGFLGSLLVGRPSLKLKFDELVPGRRFHGLEDMTLNNNRQDPALVRQCLAYQVFRDAGVAAPRCSVAHVTVNGEDLGIYTHVESIKGGFLARSFGDASGKLYEGQVSDFTPTNIATFESKGEDPDRSDLEAIMTALQSSDAELMAALGQWIDVDAFIRFWATEALVGHWDGYSGNTNNFLLYRKPANGLFYFIPWGTDGTFFLGNPFAPDSPRAVMASGALANRLYAVPEIRARYAEVMSELLDRAWNESALSAEVDRMLALLGADIDMAELAVVRDVIQTQRGAIQAELDAGLPDWTQPAPLASCFATVGSASGTFSTTWDTLASENPFAEGSASLSIQIDGQPVPFVAATAVAGPAGLLGLPQPTVQIIGVRPDDSILVLVLGIEEVEFQARRNIPFHGFATVGILVEPGTTNSNLVSNGAVQLVASGVQPGEPVSGSFSGFVYGFPAPPAGQAPGQRLIMPGAAMLQLPALLAQ